MLQGDAQNLALRIDVEQRVFVEIAQGQLWGSSWASRHAAVLQFDEKRDGVFEVANLHGVSVRSKTIKLTKL